MLLADLNKPIAELYDTDYTRLPIRGHTSHPFHRLPLFFQAFELASGESLFEPKASESISLAEGTFCPGT